MRRYRWLEISCLILMIVLLSISIFASLGGAMGLYRKAAVQNSIIHGVNGIDEAEKAIIMKLTDVSKRSAVKQYNDLAELCEKYDNIPYSEDELRNYFARGYYNHIADYVGQDSQHLCDFLDEGIRGAGIKNISVIRDGLARLDCVQADDGRITDIIVADVSIEYTDPIIGKRADTMNYRINIPDVNFYAENEELFKYCMVAGKGIYITGATSSIIGNIYAGTHSEDECRVTEAAYGEIGTFGGINILSTQLGVNADRIYCEGDINITGSFVIFEGENQPLHCFGKELNNFESFTKETMYYLDGEFVPISYDSAGQGLDDFHHTVSRMGRQFARLEKIPSYYDSDNDEGYEGPYRKIIASTDIELKEDVTGIVMTPGNVIIRNDVNVEGIIISGDRIYARGNNNIVENRSVLCKLIEYEYDTIDQMEASDYISDIVKKALTEPDYYVIPFK